MTFNWDCCIINSFIGEEVIRDIKLGEKVAIREVEIIQLVVSVMYILFGTKYGAIGWRVLDTRSLKVRYLGVAKTKIY